MWERIFLLSVVVYFIGILALLAGEYVVPGWRPVTSIVGGSIAGVSGLACVVSGVVLILTTPLPGRNH